MENGESRTHLITVQFFLQDIRSAELWYWMFTRPDDLLSVRKKKIFLHRCSIWK